MESKKIFYLPVVSCIFLILLFYVMISLPIQQYDVSGTIKKKASDDNNKVKVVKKKIAYSSFTHEAGGFKISYPNNWEMNTGKLDVEFYPKLMDRDEVAPIVTVMRAPIPEKLTLTKFYNLNREHNLDGDVYESKRIYVNGYPARMEVYTTEMPGYLTKVKEYSIFNNGKMWMIQYGAPISTYNKYLLSLDRIVNSFEPIR